MVWTGRGIKTLGLRNGSGEEVEFEGKVEHV